MFILPFVKYLKPHLWRIAFSLVCMILVSLFSAFSIALMIPALKVMVDLNATPMGVEADSETGNTPLLGVSFPTAARSETSAESEAAPEGDEATPATGSELASAEPGTPAGAAALTSDSVPQDPESMVEELMARLLPDQFRERAGREFDSRREAVRAWYEEQARNNPIELLYIFCGILLLATLIKGVAEYFSQYHLSHTFYFINLQLQEDVFRNVMAQDYLFFTRHSAGYLSSRIGSDTGSINGTLRKMVSDGIQQPMNMIAFTALLIWISPRLFLLVTLLFPPLGLMIYYFSKVLRKNTKKQKKKIDELGSSTAESLFNVRLIKAMGTEMEEVDKYVKKRKQLFKYFMQRRLVKFASGPIMELLGTLAATGILIIGGYAIFGGGVNWIGQLHPVEFGAFLYGLTKFYRPMKALSKTFMGFAVTRVAADRLVEMLALKPVVMEKENARPFEKLKDGIEFKDVSLSYNEKAILTDVSLSIPAGQVVAVVGETGSGKTTIANLLARLFDPSQGQILFDGVDLREYRVGDIRKKLGIVTQDTILFDDTVANNIAYGHDTADLSRKEIKEAVIQAAKIANADTFIRALDGGKGYQTEIGPTGCRLSGGQAQRIAIARAVFRDPQILILDEATSALDSQTQASVQDAMNHALENRTALVISHRLSTIRNADRIYVLDSGRVIEWGSFEDLMSRDGLFRTLYQAEALAETA